MPTRGALDLLLINPSGRKRIYQSLATDLAAVETPVWAGLMASFARTKGLSVALLDANAEELSPEETAERAADLAPLLTAVVVYGQQPSASTQVMPGASAVCQALKEKRPEGAVVLVGGHVAALPERTLREEAADFVAAGEGLYTLVDLALALKTSAPDLAKVRGLHYREDGALRATEAAPLVKELDAEMPGVAWDLLPMERYRAHNWHCFDGLVRQPYAALYTTLGCPYKCTFCCIQAPFRDGERALGYRDTVNSYRFWSPKRVAEEIDLLVTRYGVKNVKFADEMFVLNARHVDEICDRLIALGHDLNIWAYARVDTVRSDATLDRLRRAGFRWLAFGIEAASEKVRDDVQKGFDQDDIERTIDRVRKAGISVIGNYIFGLPEDDRTTMQETLDMALELNCEMANFYVTMAYPGSALYAQALAEGWALPASWSGFSQHAVDTLPLPTRHLSAGEVLRFRDDAFHAYFTSPRYLEMVRARFGAETEAHIREMASRRLERRFAA